MKFSKIISLAGKPGLFEILSQTKKRLIVRSITEDKRFPITDVRNISLLENIAIYTSEKEVPLAKVIKNIADKELGKEALSHKESSEKLIAYFSEVLPNFDQKRVYVSNIKKILRWYNILVKANFNFDSLEDGEVQKSEEQK
ncbi:MAG: DUF5606 domain-containing protein [Tenacibaculum sp.]